MTGRDSPALTPLLRWRWTLFTLAAALLVGGGVLTALTAATAPPLGLYQVDHTWLRWMLAAHRPPLVALAVALDIIGSTEIMVVAGLAVAAVLAWRRQWVALAGFALAIGLTEAFTWGLKELLDRPRPNVGLVGTAGDAFPSAHASGAAVTTIGAVLVLAAGRWRIPLVAGAVLYSLAMAWSRTYLAAHWLSDTIAGLCLGAGFALAVPLALAWFSAPPPAPHERDTKPGAEKSAMGGTSGDVS